MSEKTHSLKRRRTIRMVLLVTVFGLCGAAAGWWYLEVGQWVEQTDNAYIQGNLVSIASKVPGVVVYIANDQDDRVEAGQVLFKLSQGDAQAALDEAKHMLGFAVRQVMTRRAAVQTARSELRLKQTTHRLARQEFERRQTLLDRKMVSEEEVDAAQNHFEATLVELDTARGELLEAQVEAGSGDIREHPMIRVASSRLHEAVRTVNKHTLYAPISGRVAQRRVQIGQVIAAGAPLVTIIEDQNFWIEANFKETQLTSIRPGQPVTIRADIYGGETEFRGQVSSIGSGTGATFSVLPPQNATGNWIKIVQRVPVRIDFDSLPGDDFPLPIGASLDVSVDTHDRGAADRLSSGDRGQVSKGAFFEDIDAGAAELIERVINENMALVEASAEH